MPLINLNFSVAGFPFRAIQPEILDIFNCDFKTKNYTSSQKTLHNKLIHFLECFLQITNKKLDLKVLRSPAFGEICAMYIGAINSPSLFNYSQRGRYLATNMFLDKLELLMNEFQAFPYPPLNAHRIKNNHITPLCVTAFGFLNLDQEKLRVWQGWECINQKGTRYWAPLYPIYEKLGLDFSNSIHKSCIEYVSSRSEQRVPCLKRLANFINQYPDLKVEDFKSPDFMGKFWREFLFYYLTEGFKNGISIADLTCKWRTKFVYYVENYLVRPGIVAETWGAIPMPPNAYHPGGKTNLKRTPSGEYEHTKLITNVPLNCSDEDAMHLLFKQIETDVKIATDWATWAADEMWARFERKMNLGPQGTIVKTSSESNNEHISAKWLRSRKNPDHLKNAAATLAHHLHIVGSKAAASLLPTPLTQTAFELAMPITSSFIPHCIILVSNHPQITAAFLENLELFDKDGKQTGFMLQDGHYRLVSYKRRRGANLAQQSIILNETTVEVVRQIISLTASLREFLKLHGDENWRYLFLTCQKGFSHPTRIKKFTGDTCSYRSNAMADSLQNTCSLDINGRQDYVSRFSLSSLRASAAVLVYLETRSIHEMAKALGHSQTDPKLIRRYLPDPILAFFQERWIRIFQSALLVEALKDSDYLLEASGFDNILELDSFLRIHSLRLPAIPAEVSITQDEELHPSQVIFGINSQILTILISLHLAVNRANRSVHYKASYWARLTPYLISYIETYESHRPDLYVFLEEAKTKATPELMESVIYD